MLVVDVVDDVEVLDVVVDPPGSVVVVVPERGRVVPGTVVPGPLGRVDVVAGGRVVVDGTDDVEVVVVVGRVVEPGVFGILGVGVAGAGRYAHLVLSALHTWRPFELWAVELELGAMLP